MSQHCDKHEGFNKSIEYLVKSHEEFKKDIRHDLDKLCAFIVDVNKKYEDLPVVKERTDANRKWLVGIVSGSVTVHLAVIGYIFYHIHMVGIK